MPKISKNADSPTATLKPRKRGKYLILASVFMLVGAMLNSISRSAFEVEMRSIGVALRDVVVLQVDNNEPVDQIVPCVSGRKKWRICFYNGRCPWKFKLADGDDFLSVARAGLFSHRVNVSSSEAAAQSLRTLIADAAVEGAVIDAIFVVDHGNSGVQMLGDRILSDEFYRACTTALQKDSFGLVLMGCYVSQGKAGHEFLRLVSTAYSIRAYASDKGVDYLPFGLGLSFDNIWMSDTDGKPPVPVENFHQAIAEHMKRNT